MSVRRMYVEVQSKTVQGTWYRNGTTKYGVVVYIPGTTYTASRSVSNPGCGTWHLVWYGMHL